MISATEELKEVTKLVLYGWGYPAMFSTSEGQPLQNRMVRFPLDAAPAIEGVNPSAFRPIRARLELVKANYLETITNHSGINPVWVWIDTPDLTEEEIVNYQQQFMVWATQRGLTDEEVNSVAWDWRQFVPQLIDRFTRQPLKTANAWKRTVLAISLGIVLLVAHWLTSPAAACPTVAAPTGIDQCVETIGLSPESSGTDFDRSGIPTHSINP
ncbi:hypothetical protein [Egbenema bharatensis]|uniref:hypothetical protein n=1 Tax=Egbenema bharatensis TaxID=3463334 RepID=UPI003A8A8860